MIIHKKIKRSMLENKSQYFGAFALIVISCLFFTMFNLLSYNLENIKNSFGDKYIQEDANLITDKKLSNISDLETKFNMIIEEGKSFDYSVSEDKVLRIFSENTKVNIPAITTGKPLSSNNILIDPAYGKANNLKIGDTININGKPFTIYGFMSLPNYIYPLKSEGDLLVDSHNFGIAVVSKDDFNGLNDGASFYQVKFNQTSEDLSSKISKFKDLLHSDNITILNWMNSSANMRITMVDTKLKGIN